MQHARPNRLRRAMAYAALAALLGVVSLTLTRCTMVGDGLTGVKLDRGGPTTCIKQCNDTYKILYAQEQKKHLEEMEKCRELSGDEKTACNEAEAARHSAAKDALSAGKIECQNSCHRQGTGSAG